ncbi:MAG: WhiB family transcriptional regulator [Actinomycetota bacterium]
MSTTAAPQSTANNSAAAPSVVDWRTDAACKDEPVETFFSSQLVGRAKRICGRCPVREACRGEAVSNGVADGVWGGWTPEERRAGRIAEPSPLRPRRRPDLVTPACASCSTGLGWPLAAVPASNVAEGSHVVEVVDGERWLVLHPDDLRFSASASGELRCPGCGTDVGQVGIRGMRLRDDAVALEDTRRRRRQMQAAS